MLRRYSCSMLGLHRFNFWLPKKLDRPLYELIQRSFIDNGESTRRPIGLPFRWAAALVVACLVVEGCAPPIPTECFRTGSSSYPRRRPATKRPRTGKCASRVDCAELDPRLPKDHDGRCFKLGNQRLAIDRSHSFSFGSHLVSRTHSTLSIIAWPHHQVGISCWRHFGISSDSEKNINPSQIYGRCRYDRLGHAQTFINGSFQQRQVKFV